MTLSTRQTYLLFIAVILSWSFNWLAMKIGLQYTTALWYASFRLCFSALILFAFLAYRRKIYLPHPKDWPLIFTQGFLQMGLYMTLVIIALHYVGAGRTVILCYATLLWSTPIAVFIYKEPLSAKKLAGFILSLLGIAVYFDPAHFQWHNEHRVIGSLIALTASACWGLAMAHARFGRWHATPSQLYPWKIISAAAPIGLLTLLTQTSGSTHWNSTLILTLTFSTVFATLFAWWGMIILAKALPSTTTAVGVLAVPVIVVILASLVLHEHITSSLVTALSLIIAGIVLVSLDRQKASPEL
ncbi:MAG: hypothetical protein COV52_08690 [Gammaproteobacteria bacterium CG11_big_fil_rev_8_21_14_0_20_46_22]|nr:MAG: hypothetical protein COW05_01160 [Gammaproteobacteria bacterium CG12_big_fil_rev_8_21_14_0_65_46_12]PIR10568.1 MAG: hypothetical protein COV52_08690 [Gammaproteobacteria bacterium CG11_big_fil_rev_8_21_14_0_20_46_22]